MRPGYKRTEVGVIPEEWSVKRFGDVASLRKERVDPQRDSAHGFCVELKHVEPGTGQLIGDASTGTQVSMKSVFRAGDVLFGKLRAYLRKHWLADRDGVCSTEFWVLSANRQLITPEYLFHSVTTQEFVEMASMAYGTHMPRSDWNVVKDYMLSLPEVEEQHLISSALNEVDSLISSLGRLIAKKRDIKQAAIQQLFTGKRRLPGFCEEWAVRKLGEIGFTYGGLAGKTKPDFGSGSARYIPFLNVINNVAIDPKNLESVRVTPSEVQNRVLRGDLFFNGSSETPEEVGMCSVLLHDFDNVYLNSFCFGFRLYPDAKVDGLYLACFIRSGEGRKLMYALAQGATRYNLSKANLLQLAFPIPPLDEQRAIASVLSDMDAEIEALERRRDKTRLIKQGMMQELLTGRVRLV